MPKHAASAGRHAAPPAPRHGHGKKKRRAKRRDPWRASLASLLIAALGLAVWHLTRDAFIERREQKTFDSLAVIKAESAAAPAAGGVSEAATPAVAPAPGTPAPENSTVSVAEEKEKMVLPEYARLHELNREFFGWLTAEAVGVDFPVMYSPDRADYYLNRDFYGRRSNAGTPFIDGNCPPEGNFYLIHGHHMADGEIFGQLESYLIPGFAHEHPTITFDTLYEHREYEIVFAFRSQVHEDSVTGVFKYYECADLTDEASFNEYVRQVRAIAAVDTGAEVQYGDELLALSTCHYHVLEGRLVVVGKRIE